MYPPGQKKLPPDHRILKIRAYEDQLAKFQTNQKTQIQMSNIASWEENTTNKIVQRTINNRFETLKAQREERLDERRERLARKLYEEEAVLQDELIASRPTAEQNKKALTDKARAMAAARESRRQQEANDLMMRHFRENCDPIREQDSKKRTMKALADRQAQIQHRAYLDAQQKEERNRYDELYELERLKKEKRYEDDMRQIRENNAAVTKVLDEQMVRVSERMSEEDAARQAEIATLHAQWRAADEAAAAAEASRRNSEAQRVREVKAFNELKTAMDQEREAKEFQEDLKFVTMATQKAAEDEARDRDAKERRRKETLEFRRQLEELAVREAEDSSAQDALIQAAQDREMAKYDAEQEAKEEARRKLMAEVLEERAKQLRDARSRAEEAKAEDIAEKERARLESASLADLEAELRMRDKQGKMQQRLDIQAQIWAKEQRQAAEEEQKFREAEGARNAEAQYLGVVDQVQSIPARDDFRRKKVEWYY